jgi:predicted enzyme related to lactoylglutathione lyase
MATKTKKPNKTKVAAVPPSIIWFEIPADDVARAKTFYSKLFGWKIKKFPGPMEYWHIDTDGSDDSPDGGLMKRQDPKQTITNYINVASVDKYMKKVEALGGKVCMGKTAVPEMGFFAICLDPENNAFAIWERIGTAK